MSRHQKNASAIGNTAALWQLHTHARQHPGRSQSGGNKSGAGNARSIITRRAVAAAIICCKTGNRTFGNKAGAALFHGSDREMCHWRVEVSLGMCLSLMMFEQCQV
jgi:hypothetical protein